MKNRLHPDSEKIIEKAKLIAEDYNHSEISLTHLGVAFLEDMQIETELSDRGVDVETAITSLRSTLETFKGYSKPNTIENTELLNHFIYYSIFEFEALFLNEIPQDLMDVFASEMSEKEIRESLSINVSLLFSYFLSHLIDLSKNDQINSEILNILFRDLNQNQITKLIHYFLQLGFKDISDMLNNYGIKLKTTLGEDLDLNDNELNHPSEEGVVEDDIESLFELGKKEMGKSKKQQKEKEIALTFLTNMNKLYNDKKINEQIFNREEETNEMIRILSRKNKSNPLLIGEAGVGKTAVVENLVGKIERGEVPPKMKNKTIYSLNLTKLTAGTKYRGEFEQRSMMVLDFIKSDPNAILFLDEMHTANGEQHTNFATLMKTDLTSSQLKCIGVTTYNDFSRSLVKDKALIRRFQQITIKEPSLEVTFDIVKKSLPDYIKHHNIEYTDEVLEKTLYLCDRYLHKTRFPDKAFDVIDEIGSLYSSGLRKNKKNEVKIEDVMEIISKKSNINIQTKEDEIKKLTNLEKMLKQKIYGQDDVIEKLSETMFIAETDLGSPNKPFASLLFTGPTGVGKTEVINELSKILSRPLHRFDMSEHGEQNTVSKLIGAPPGYIGHDEGGMLTKIVDEDPYSIVLLDEIEKAHPKIYNTFLQVFDNGFLTDSRGNKVSFRNTIIVMTSNVGVQERKNSSIGFTSSDENVDIVKDGVLSKYFAPEFINRLSAVVNFNYLKENNINRITKKAVNELSERLTQQGIKLSVTNAAIKWLSAEGYNKELGARPLERTVQSYIAKPIAKEIINSYKTKKPITNIQVKIEKENLKYDVS